MKKRLVYIILFAIILVLSSCAASPSRVGVVDMDLILEESERALNMQKELSEIGSKLENDYNKIEDDLSTQNREEELDKIYKEFLDNKQRLEEQLTQEIKDVINDIANSSNLDIVIDKKNVYCGGIDITQEAIENLDKVSEGGAGSNGD
jgi:Skp family chaperone for outer membrane proteins